mmetsp:Transcript_9089/g.15832  ORF Transcript_9089/g.15832 Transcript_9089/m.15832 type:complete len:288 (-) Transcript_9089:155-1018(-)|eukprot:CAMPEP_0119102898 /NCGR_PEP_ID=MMETSP1180-20130426/1496_1 /TAXON_ID=3052 ORGANISM="Chlamydomonas cf sp, Strain CCMP681" /NCGR_SAMPLE_ID=MMETSP1180 /ASSEMBLY_ACC=CAM_ASM_000741 /LENGTH=287 /DNA_ID=CAMNT_0007087277 /DNA_START=32 /DNA_END=895 /DNA_ORIENTATION=+
MADIRAQSIKALRSLETIRLNGLRFRLIDARGLIVGKLATQISVLLQGKDKPIYTPKQNMGDVVIVINAAHLHFTQDKWDTKLYRWHTGFPGGLRQRTAAEEWDRDPTEVLRKAVNGMLPKNLQRIYRMDKLKIFPEEDHPFKALPLSLYVPSPRTLHLPGMGWSLPPGLDPMNPKKYALRRLASPYLQQEQAESKQQPPAPPVPSTAHQAQGQQGQGKAGQEGGKPEKGSRGRKGERKVEAGKTASGSGALGLADLESLLTEEERVELKKQVSRQQQQQSQHQKPS